MIKVTDEAVEACARTYYENLGWDWASLDTEAREHDESKAIILEEFRQALEAAVPHLQVQAELDRDAVAAALVEFGANVRTERGEPAILLGDAVDAVMRLAHPAGRVQVDREAIYQAIEEAAERTGIAKFMEEEDTEAFAAAVLALLSPEETK